MYDRNIRDANLSVSGALPNGNGITYAGDLDLGAAGISHPELESLEVEVRIPLLTTSEAPDGSTLQFEVCQGVAGSPSTLVSAKMILTGAGGVGIAKTTVRLRLQPNAGRYLRAKFTGGATFGNASIKSGVLSLVF